MVIEGFRNESQNVLIDGSQGRTEEIRAFLSKCYSLISNLGEHHGTQGSRLDAEFARDITVSTSRYMSQKLAPGEAK